MGDGPKDWERVGKDLRFKSRIVTRKAVDGGDVGAILKAFGVNVTPQAYMKGELTARCGSAGEMV